MSKKCKDHLGNEFDSISDMCRHWGVSRATFDSRLKVGYTLEQSLSGKNIVSKSEGRVCTDHLGNEFDSQIDMCRHWGVDERTFYRRLQRGYSVEQCLTGRDIDKGTGKKKSCEDHLGNSFNSQADMLRYWGVTAPVYYNRLKLGHSLESCLTGRGVIDRERKTCTDHTGKEFESISAMCKYWNVNIATYYSRLRKGWSIEQCLTGGRK